MYKLLTTSKDNDDLSVGFDRNRDRRQRELTNNKTQRGKYHVSIMLKDIFGFAQHQDKRTLGLGYTSTISRNTDNAVLNKGDTINNAKIKIYSITWYVPHYTPSLEQQTILSNRIVKKIPTELRYIEISVVMKEVNTQNFWTFELGNQKGMNVPLFLFVVFQKRNRQDSQNLNNDTFYRPPVTVAQCNIGSERYPDNSIILNYDDDDNSERYAQIKETFRALTRDDILQLYISYHYYRSNIDGNDIGYSLYVFDIRYQKNLTNSQPNKIEFIFSDIILLEIYGYAIILTKKLISIS